MTTIILSKPALTGITFSDITIDAFKIEETSSKELMVNFARPIAIRDFGLPTNLKPERMTFDTLSINRVFTITGRISKECMTGARSAPEVRDMLVNMQRAGGTIIFKYGIPDDPIGYNTDGTLTTYYTADGNNMYYSSNGFKCHITRLQINEDPKGGSSLDETSKNPIDGSYGTSHKMPQNYEVTIELLFSNKEAV